MRRRQARSRWRRSRTSSLPSSTGCSGSTRRTSRRSSTARAGRKRRPSSPRCSRRAAATNGAAASKGAMRASPRCSRWRRRRSTRTNVARGTYVAVDGIVQPAPAPRFSRTPAALPTAARGAGRRGGAARMGDRRGGDRRVEGRRRHRLSPASLASPISTGPFRRAHFDGPISTGCTPPGNGRYR